MPSQVLSSVENNFTKGLVTEFTGLNFPENAATDTDNCVYTLVGDVVRRQGFDYEDNFVLGPAIDRTNRAITDYKWNNVSGDGVTQLVVRQVGNVLYFYQSNTATTSAPLSAQLLASTVDMNALITTGGTFDITAECQFADGNGFLFVYHPSIDPIYCSFVSNQVIATPITVQIRDFTGASDSFPVTFRPPASVITSAHVYNLTNQGWNAAAGYSFTPSTIIAANAFGVGSRSFQVASGVTGVVNGDSVTAFITFRSILWPHEPDAIGSFVGTVTSYSGTTLVINVNTWNPPSIDQARGGGLANYSSVLPYTIIPGNQGYLNTWIAAVGNYPSNSDVWWYYKNSAGAFSPATTLQNVTANTGNAPRGHFILNAFDQKRSAVSSIPFTSDVVTTVRPRTGTWFQGRVWYTGVDASQAAGGTSNAYSWTESVYFSQIINDSSQFGYCYQVNDPTSETLFDLLPTDGGEIKIQGCGPIYKLFPLQNAMLIFASNGVWYLTGSQGIGFTANDYTIVKLSSVKSISSSSFVDVNGLPMFWNEEGIYSVEAAKQGTGLLNSPLHVNPLEVIPLTVGSILSFYDNIPLQSKKFVKGDYNPIDYVVQWVYRSTNEADVTTRYEYDRVLNFNNSNKAFFPYTLSTGDNMPAIHGIRYISSPGGSSGPNSVFKYSTSSVDGKFTFSEELDTDYVDWASTGAQNYESFLVTGFKLHGQGQRRFQIPYLYVFSRGDVRTAYKIQGLWDYAVSGDSGRWSVAQLITNWSPNFGMIFRRHKIRGQGIVLQIKISSAAGIPFDIMGWSSFETQNTGV